MNFIPHTNNSLFIGDLSKFCTEQNLEELFSSYGEITEVKIKRNISTGKTLSYGFVTFADDECAAIAMQELDGCLYCGRNLRIRWAVHNVKEQKVEEQIINSVYVRFITPKLHEFITEEDFHKVFDVFGCVEDVSIKESSIDKRTNRQSGYGFVHFSCNNAGIAAAFQAVSTVDNATFDGVLYNVELSKNLLKQFNEMKSTKTNQTNVPSHPNSRKNNHMPIPAASNGLVQYNSKHYNNNDLQSGPSTSNKYTRSNNNNMHHLESLGFHNQQQQLQQQSLSQYDHAQNHRYPSLASSSAVGRSGSSSLSHHTNTIPPKTYHAMNDNSCYKSSNNAPVLLPGNDFYDMQSNYDSGSNASSSKPTLSYSPTLPGQQQPQPQVPLPMRQKTVLNNNNLNINARTITRSTAASGGENFYRSTSTNAATNDHPTSQISLLYNTSSNYNTRDVHSMVDSFQGFHIGNTPTQSLINQGMHPNTNAAASNVKMLSSLSSSHSSDIFHKQPSDRYIAIRNDSNTLLNISGKNCDDINNNSFFNMSSKSCEDVTTNSVHSDSGRYSTNDTDFTMSTINNSDIYRQNYAEDFNFIRHENSFYSHSLSNTSAAATTATDHPLAIRAQWQLRDPIPISNFGNELDPVLENGYLMKTFSEMPVTTQGVNSTNNTSMKSSTSRLPSSYQLQQQQLQQTALPFHSTDTLQSSLLSTSYISPSSNEDNINPTTLIADIDGSNSSSSKEYDTNLANKEGKAITASMNKSKQLPLTQFFAPILKKS